MLEGKEVQGQELNGALKYEVDVTPDLKIKLSAEFDLVQIAEDLAKKTNTPVDDQAIAWLKLIVGKA